MKFVFSYLVKSNIGQSSQSLLSEGVRRTITIECDDYEEAVLRARSLIEKIFHRSTATNYSDIRLELIQTLERNGRGAGKKFWK